MAQRFALVAAAGEISTAYSILPWREGEATTAAARCFGDWLAARGGIKASEIRDAIERVRAFVSANGLSRFLAAWEDDGHKNGSVNADSRQPPPIRDLAGFRKRSGDGWDCYVTPSAWRGEACQGFDAKATAAALVERGFLYRPRTGRTGRHSCQYPATARCGCITCRLASWRATRMIDLSAALARAFDKHLEIRGNSGYRGNQTAELSEPVIPDHEGLVATANRPMATVATGTPARRRAAPPVATIATDRKVVATGAAARRMAEGRALGRPVSTVATVATGPEHEAHDFADGVPTPDTEFATALWGPVARRNAVPSSRLAGTQALPTPWRLEHRRTPRLAQRQPHRRRLDHRGNRGTPMAPRATTTGQIGADAVTKAMTNASARSAEGRVPPVQVRLQRVNASISRVYPPDGQNEVWWQRLKAALGSCSSAFVNAALIQLQQAARLPTSSISETAVNAALAMI